MEERLMCNRKGLRPRAKSLPQAMREFLTPAVFRQVRQAADRRRKPRWDVHPLVFVLLLATWAAGDSLPEKFEIARGFYAVCCPKRKRAGKTFSGFEKALAKLPMPVLRVLADALRGRIVAVFGERLYCHGFIPLGCDGTRQECPRTAELEQRLGTFGKDGSAPMIWNTSIVHLALGIPWCWRFGRGGKASERTHLLQMLPLLPQMALIVTDAGYVGYELVRQLIEDKVLFLMRMSSNATFYTERETPLKKFREGIVYYWPKTMQDKGQPPLRGRLIRITERRRKHDVWLFTNVEDKQQLPHKLAAKFYRWRWESEGFFRTYKRTLNKIKLDCQTLRTVHREAEGSMIATQLLLCLGARALPASSDADKPIQSSPRKVLLAIRHDLGKDRSCSDFSRRLAKARREQRERKTEKEKRVWPRRKPHKPPAPPNLLPIDDELKPKFEQHISAA
jgi:hypothetical protein